MLRPSAQSRRAEGPGRCAPTAAFTFLGSEQSYRDAFQIFQRGGVWD